jgi:multidrug efflux pump subunit AcrB
MNPARVSSRHARAVLLVTALLAAAGFISLTSLPSDIYPPLNFPRVVIIGHTGTLPARSMELSVTRPIEQVVMEVPGIRRVRSKTFRGSTEISAQFDPAPTSFRRCSRCRTGWASCGGSCRGGRSWRSSG